MAVKDIRANLETIPETLTRQTFESICRTVLSEKFDSQRQAFFLHREAVETLVSRPFMDNSRFAADSIRFLQDLLVNGNRDKKRAVYESLGSLDGAYDPPLFEIEPCSGFTSVSVERILEKPGPGNPERGYWKGRSLLNKLPDGGIRVIKFAETQDKALLLYKEACWMDRFKSFPLSCGIRFDSPRPLELDGRYLLKIRNGFKGFSYAILYKACPDYFAYPNTPFASREYSPDLIRKIFSHNAWLLGKLASMGILHNAVIPLFHNRVQQGRREDMGRYDWEHGGRLDQWLESCRHPNIALSGLRDFEHLEFADPTTGIKRCIGEHLLSLILIAGSFFRNREPALKGYDAKGAPVDARQLFDRSLLENILEDLIHYYGSGFTGLPFRNSFSKEVRLLAEELVDEMGVDRHMEEVLRIEDQNRLDTGEFRNFLLSRGIGKDELAGHEAVKGMENLSISTGPHLGGFNRRISTPRLIDLLFTLSALFISERYLCKKLETGDKKQESEIRSQKSGNLKLDSGRPYDQPVSRMYDTPS